MSIILLVLGGLMYGIGIFCQKSQKPIHFYSGTNVKEEVIRDISAYNQENARMWKRYSFPFFLAAFLALGSSFWATIVLLINGSIGTVVLILSYERIFRKYRKK